MTERSYTHTDKTGWGEGPWNDEPDKVQWVDEATGLDCLIVRGSHGALCGYVGVPPEHPWHGHSHSRGIDGGGYFADDCPCFLIAVHGGLTYSADDERILRDRGICHVPAAGRPKDVWWFGFDCTRYYDIAPGLSARMPGVWPPRRWGASYRTVDYVRAECARLAEQLVGASVRA